MPARRILILGGTGDAREAAGLLMAQGFETVTSLAGVTAAPVLPPGAHRIGGFGGSRMLAEYVAAGAFLLVVDATHPFAARMSAQAAEACRAVSVPLLRLERPGWTSGDGDSWENVSSITEAAACLPAGARVLLTIGRKEVAPFFARSDLSGVARMIEPPAAAAPPGWQVLRERPPFDVAHERALMEAHGVTHLVTKNAGGGATAAKLAAARERRIPVVMVVRPAKPDAATFATPGELAEAVKRLLSP